MGKGIENYLGQYGNYYPGGHAWLPGHWTNDRGGTWTNNGYETYKAMNPDTGQYEVVRLTESSLYVAGDHPSSADPAQSGYGDPTMIGLGAFGNGVTVPPAGELRAGPLGLGFLLTTGVVPDPRSFFCPSAKDVDCWFLPTDLDKAVAGSWQRTYLRWPFSNGVIEDGRTVDLNGNAGNVEDTVREWLNAGPLTPHTLTHGNWTKRQHGYYDRSAYMVAMQYMYRNHPIFKGGSENPKGHRDDTTPPLPPTPADIGVITIAYTSPKVTSHAMCPPFKTPKALKGRALASDNWLKSPVVTEPGFGNDVHEDGYSVLYGNYNVNWYSDVEKRLIYFSPASFTTAGGTSYSGNIDPAGSTADVGGLICTRDYAGPSISTYNREALLFLPAAWHILDQAQGIDLSWTEKSWFDAQGW